jgi:hypothetical protein
VTDKKKGLIVSRQVASAQAFKAWMSEPLTNEIFLLDVMVYPPSLGHIKGTEISQFTLPAGDYDFLLCGTSLEAYDDSKWFEWARSKGIPSIAYVDQWVNYSARFRKDMLPDYILVTDKVAAEDLKRELNTDLKVIVAGTPALNYIKDFWATHRRNPKSEIIIYFATEPTTPEYSLQHGLTDLNQLDHLIETFRSDSRVSIKVKPHPSDSIERLIKYEKLITSESKNEVFENASILAGMRSMLLFEASLLGIPVLSLQIGRKTKSSLTDNRPNIKVVTDAKDLNLNFQITEPDLSLCNNSWTESIIKITRSPAI